MKCPRCGLELGEGLLPARCPSCGHNLTALNGDSDAADGARRAASRRAAVDGLVSGMGRERSHKLRPVIALGVVALFVLAIVYTAWSLGFVGGTAIPDVTGWRLERAVDDIEKAGLTTQTTTAKADGDPGCVVTTEPKPGSRVEPGSMVTVVVSEEQFMPEVVGLSLDEAKARIAEVNGTVEVQEVSSDQPSGTVLSCATRVGGRVTSTEPIKLTVSRDSVVPTVMGLKEGDAKNAITNEGLLTAVNYTEVQEGQTAGTVVAVDPAEGTSVGKGGTVTISVASDKNEELSAAALKVIQAVYNCDPIEGGYPIGATLKTLLAPDVVPDYQTDAWTWCMVVKHRDIAGQTIGPVEYLVRSLKDTPQFVVQGSTVKATFTVEWQWGRMGVDKTTTDTRSVTMTFNEAGQLLTFDDPLTDVPVGAK